MFVVVYFHVLSFLPSLFPSLSITQAIASKQTKATEHFVLEYFNLFTSLFIAFCCFFIRRKQKWNSSPALNENCTNVQSMHDEIGIAIDRRGYNLRWKKNVRCNNKCLPLKYKRLKNKYSSAGFISLFTLTKEYMLCFASANFKCTVWIS